MKPLRNPTKPLSVPTTMNITTMTPSPPPKLPIGGNTPTPSSTNFHNHNSQNNALSDRSVDLSTLPLYLIVPKEYSPLIRP